MSAAPGIYRPPDARFDDLPGFPFEPHYRQWRGMRLAYLDEGGGAPIVMLHGEPTWSCLYRKVMGRSLPSGGPGRTDRNGDRRVAGGAALTCTLLVSDADQRGGTARAMPAEPEPVTVAQVVHRAIEVTDPEGANYALAEPPAVERWLREQEIDW
ncbi:MAG: hypothetical protein ACTHQQ_14345 [Solirubrobacteraceae bacterium]